MVTAMLARRVSPPPVDPDWSPVPAAEMTRIRLLALLALCSACDPSAGPGAGMRHEMDRGVDTTGLRGLPIPAELRRGLALYAASCASCHGEAALGTSTGPPLVHRVYEPGHHADAAFVLAAQRGVRAHHWSYGDMPPRPDVSREDALEIARYVRWLQRAAGVF